MSMGKELLNDDLLEQVSGGLRKFNRNTQVLTYDRSDGSTVKYKILDYKKAWDLSNSLEGRMSEDQIIQRLINLGYIQ